MGRPLYTNNAATYLAFGISNTDTTMQVSANAGSLFPSPTGGDYFYVSLISLSGPIIEIVKCTARSGDIFTIERGQEGTSAQYWNMGDNVQLRITAAGMNYIAGAAVQSTEEQVFTATQGQTVFTLTEFDYAPGTNNLAVFVNGSKQVYGTNYSETSVNTVTFNSGLNAGDIVEFLVGISVASGTLYATDIKYNEGSTGAVQRTVASKLQESVSVLDFGAVGDGITDDTAAIQLALNSSNSVLFPSNNEFKVTSYLSVPSNIYIRIEGTINFYNRQAGFAVVNQQNIEIEGTEGSRIYDSAVQSNYIFNNTLTGPAAPIVHIRQNGSGSNQYNFMVNGIRADHISMGVLIDVANTNYWTNGINGTGQDGSHACFDAIVQNCNIQYSEGVAIGAWFAYKPTFKGNYVYRAGDAGIYFIQVSQGLICDNFRESPYGDGSASTTINDGEGISVEKSSDCIISRNRVVAFQDHGIDVKNGASRITVVDNLLVDCQYSSICARLGDASGQSDVNYIYISNNEIKNNGFVHTSAYGSQAAISVDSYYHAVVENNKINGLKACYGIYGTGPGNELVTTMSGSPRQSFLSITNNNILWHAVNYDFAPQFLLDDTVLDAIHVSGGYLTKLVIENNNVVGDRYSNDDVRNNTSYGIYVSVDTTTAINNHYGWPNSIAVKNNSVYGWLGSGIIVTSDGNSVRIATNIEGNKVEYIRANGIYVYKINGLTLTNNFIVRANPIALVIDTCLNILASNNQAILSDTASNSGTDGQTYGLQVANSTNGLISYNRFEGTTSATTLSGNTNITLSNNL
jgi:hypothetical protein